MNTPVNFEIGKVLKEKGYDVECSHHYEYALTSRKDVEQGYKGPFGWKKGECSLQSGFFINNYKGVDLSNKSWYLCSAPTIAEVIMWLYEKYGIWISVEPPFPKRIVLWEYYIQKSEDRTSLGQNSGYDSPTEAYTAAIQHALKHLI